MKIEWKIIVRHKKLLNFIFKMCIYVTELKINKHIKIKLVFPKNEIKNMYYVNI